MLNALKGASPWEAFAFFIVVNAMIFLFSTLLCLALGRLFSKRRIFDRWEPLRPLELAAAMSSIVMNAMISMLGWWLWTRGVIVLATTTLLFSLVNCIAMTLFMDLAMYWSHRLAHTRLVFKHVHAFHHRHETTNPISLFVLHPIEVMGFGSLMIVYLVLVPTDLVGLTAYLALNVLWGTLGHSGVEPLPGGFIRAPLLCLSGTSTFHAEHHERLQYNFGFYTLLWDRVFGTLDPEYEQRFRQQEVD